MKQKLLFILSTIIIFLNQNILFAQTPELGATSSYALFTAAGALTNSGSSHITGDIGTFAGAFTGFIPATVSGQTHIVDPASAIAAVDVATAYTQLSTAPCSAVLGTTLGNNQVLTSNVYCLGAASTLNGDLILDGQGNPNAIFIFKIDGALTTGVFTNIILTNSTSLCNVYWQVNGAFTLSDNSVFRGTVIANGAIVLSEGSALYGRGLSLAGAITLHNNLVAVVASPIPVSINAGNIQLNCTIGSSTPMASNNWNTVWSSSNSLVASINAPGPAGSNGTYITAVSNGTTTITVMATNAMTGCTTTKSIIYTVAAVSVAPVQSASSACAGSANFTATNSTNNGVWVAENNLLSISNTGVVTPGINAGVGIISYTVTNAITGCSTKVTKSITILALPAIPNVNVTPSISNQNAICNGRSFQFTGTPSGGIWNTTNIAVATITPGGLMNTVGTGTATLSYTVTNAFGCSNSRSFNGKVISCFARGANQITAFINEPIMVYPNPAKGTVIVKGKGIKEVIFINSTGRIVKKYTIDINYMDTLFTETVNIQSLHRGLYLVKIIDINGVTTSEKLMVN